MSDNNKVIKGYKVFNPDWRCRDFQYEVGKTYHHEGTIEVCSSGFHFCANLIDCFNYYSFDPRNKVAEIEASGDVIAEEEKSVTSCIRIVREMSWQEVLGKVNTGMKNNGLGNTGDSNEGNWNTGNRNEGRNNTGNGNKGGRNSGSGNTGNYNSGDVNWGNCNTGSYNKGDYNTGLFNEGNRNVGNFNVGNCNIGSYNKGEYNAGHWNLGDGNTGFFNTKNSPFVTAFNKETTMRRVEFLCLNGMIVLENKFGRNPEKNRSVWKNELSPKAKKAVLDLPNFDAEIFKKITGVDVNAE